jgi:uncharacterized protein (DUF924 family)
MDTAAQEVLEFWLKEVGSEGWYATDPALDARIRERFLPLWEAARRGSHATWICTPDACLALAIVLDQFPRNMFRGDARSFATDARALAVAKSAIQRGHDRRIDLPERQFFYMPLGHSEVLANQDRAVRHFLLSFGHGEMLDHARAHRAIIRRFGRFPGRNAVLGRVSTPDEEAFLEAGGYQAAKAEGGLRKLG